METVRLEDKIQIYPICDFQLWTVDCGAVVVVRSEIVCPVRRGERRGEGGSLLPVWSHCSVTEQQPGSHQGWSWALICLTAMMVR